MHTLAELQPLRKVPEAGAVRNGFSTPPLLLLILLMTNNRKIMDNQVNSRPMNLLGWLTAVVIFCASGGLVVTWFL